MRLEQSRYLQSYYASLAQLQLVGMVYANLGPEMYITEVYARALMPARCWIISVRKHDSWPAPNLSQPRSPPGAHSCLRDA